MTICHQFTALLLQPLLQLVPVLSPGVVVRRIGERPYHIRHGEVPLLPLQFLGGADLLVFKKLDLIVCFLSAHGMYLPDDLFHYTIFRPAKRDRNEPLHLSICHMVCFPLISDLYIPLESLW